MWRMHGKRALSAGRVKFMSRKADDLAERIGYAIVAVPQTAGFRANLCSGSESFEPGNDLVNTVDGDPEVANAQFPRAVSRFEYGDVVKAVGESDIPGIGTAELLHGKVL